MGGHSAKSVELRGHFSQRIFCHCVAVVEMSGNLMKFRMSRIANSNEAVEIPNRVESTKDLVKCIVGNRNRDFTTI